MLHVVLILISFRLQHVDVGMQPQELGGHRAQAHLPGAGPGTMVLSCPLCPCLHLSISLPRPDTCLWPLTSRYLRSRYTRFSRLSSVLTRLGSRLDRDQKRGHARVRERDPDALAIRTLWPWGHP